MPSTDTLRRCFEENPDGAGFMWPERGRVQFRKGFMGWGDLESALSSELPRDARGLPVALHFRIATHGRVKPGCCHPFAVCKDYRAMRAESTSAAAGFMHNGTLAGLDTSPDVSDKVNIKIDDRVTVPSSLARLHNRHWRHRTFAAFDHPSLLLSAGRSLSL